MRNFAKTFIGVMALVTLAACAHQGRPAHSTQRCGKCARASTAVASPAVATPAPVQQTACNGCQPTEYTVKTPVEVVYKNTTYRTVYVPQTTQSVSYEKRPYVAGELCGNGSCARQ